MSEKESQHRAELKRLLRLLWDEYDTARLVERPKLREAIQRQSFKVYLNED